MKPRICCHKEASFIKFQLNIVDQTSPKLLCKMFKKTQTPPPQKEKRLQRRDNSNKISEARKQMELTGLKKRNLNWTMDKAENQSNLNFRIFKRLTNQ